MGTFSKEDVEPSITLENAADVAAESQAAAQYGLDSESLNRSVVKAFTDNIQ
jgi:hypothetical protein